MTSACRGAGPKILALRTCARIHRHVCRPVDLCTDMRTHMSPEAISNALIVASTVRLPESAIPITTAERPTVIPMDSPTMHHGRLAIVRAKKSVRRAIPWWTRCQAVSYAAFCEGVRDIATVQPASTAVVPPRSKLDKALDVKLPDFQVTTTRPVPPPQGSPSERQHARAWA